MGGEEDGSARISAVSRASFNSASRLSTAILTVETGHLCKRVAPNIASTSSGVGSLNASFTAPTAKSKFLRAL